ncbi:MAG TPA: hypothetical protein VMU81_20445 [Acetobacteraceae bacterium]|jgi:hypothetical protein|nr:hypothetical protein [Acetobacteraceae bacterium]
MDNLGYAAAVFAAVVMLSGGAALANVCQTDHMMCGTTMPIDGYCECHTHGNSEGGTVVSKLPPHSRMNATAGGCGTNPNSPGCR